MKTISKLFWKFIAVFKITFVINGLLFLQKKGLRAFWNAVKGRLTYTIKRYSTSKLLQNRYAKELAEIITHSEKEIIIISPVFVDWHIPLFQRPQHIAQQLGKHNVLYFYATGNSQYDHVKGFEKINDGCYLTDQYDVLIRDIPEAFIHLYSTDLITRYETILKYIAQGHKIIYEYIDEIHQDISGFIPPHALEKHISILSNENIYVIATADKLYEDIKKYRSRNFALITNGGDPEHYNFSKYSDTVPDCIKKIVHEKKPIIGYFGALASWFDYELVRKCAEKHPDWNILLLGHDYDSSIKKSKFEQFTNILTLGPIAYTDLPLYARYFTVSTIPFIINDVTESTSPVKLFEYMSMKKPIVTTDMPECRKYKSVYIGKSHDEYIQKIELALQMKDNEEYMLLLEKEAQENSWFNKARQIIHLIKSS